MNSRGVGGAPREHLVRALRALTLSCNRALGSSALIALLGVSACQTPKSTPTPVAEFGIFFGGQIQERQFIPFELNSAKQRIGFRLLFPTPLPDATEVRWEVSRPGAREPRALPVSKPDRRVTEFGSATLAAGERRFEQLIALRPGDPLGLWNLRVSTPDDVLLDRPFSLYDADERRRARARARTADAGL